MSTLKKLLLAGAAGAAALGLSAFSAQAAADLVIVEEDSSIQFGSCEKDEPIATGLIAIKNIGDSRARLRLGVLTRYSRSLLAVYVPEHLDMIDNGYERSALDSRDQESIRVSVAKGVVKRGRFRGDGSTGGYVETQPSYDSGLPAIDTASIVRFSDLTSSELQDMQRALRDLGLYRGGIDGVFGSGGLRAVRAFQRSLGDRETGELTVGQIDELSRQTGRALSIGPIPTAVANTQPTARAAVSQPVQRGSGIVEVTLYASVDPYNLVEESDETNNLMVFRGTIDCR